jgi:hypothetical protein
MPEAEQLFSQQDRELIEALVFNPSLEPEYNALSTCLYWDDELSLAMTREGRKVVRKLWIIRSLFHRGLTCDDHDFSPDACREMWKQATEEIPDWPGFKRLVLSKKDKEYFEKWLAVENPFD